MSMDFNTFFRELFDQTVTLGMASAFSIASQKFLKMSFGAPVSIKPFITLALALCVGTTVLKMIQKKYDFLDNPIKKSQ